MTSRPISTPRRTATSVRRHPFLVAYWRKGRLLLCNYVTGASMDARGADLDVLQRASRWMPLATLERDVAEGAGAEAVARIAPLLHFGALETMDGKKNPRDHAAADWHNWGPAAVWFHQGVKNVPFVGPEAAHSVAHRLLNAAAAVPTYAVRGTATQVRLGDFRRAAPEVSSTLLSRRTWRRYADRPLAAADLSALLGFTWGVQRWMRVSPQHRLPLKTSPSGGACHSIDCYVLALAVEGLEPGIYRYDADAHAMSRVRGASRGDARRYLQSQPAFAECAAIFFMAAVFPRVQWKYQTARAYRVVMIEAGHLGQTFCLTATALGLAPFSTAVFADEELERDLGLDGLSESVIYATGVGVRPADVSWAPFPDGATPATEHPAWTSRLIEDPR